MTFVLVSVVRPLPLAVLLKALLISFCRPCSALMAGQLSCQGCTEPSRARGLA